jgi:hypothetical protein
MKVAGIVLTAVLLGSLVACGGKAKGATADPGVQACQMMKADKASGLTPGDNRSAQEIKLLSDSRNTDLQRAGSRLVSDDMATQMQAIGDLYTGCAAAGVRIN